MIKRIFSDMDGTLLDNTGAVSEENVSLIKSAGIPMTLVSARAPMANFVVKEMLRNLIRKICMKNME